MACRTNVGVLGSGDDLYSALIMDRHSRGLRIFTLSLWKATSASWIVDLVVPVTIVDQLAVPLRAESKRFAVVPT